MLASVVLSVFFLCAVHATIINDCAYPEILARQPAYYWRDYYGVIPKDAVAGGYSEDGNITYISQVPSPKYPGIFPGIIYQGQKNTVACARERVVVEINVKILCANPSENFQWISTRADESHVLTDYHWVVGGSNNYSTFYIGRATYEGQVQVGRVFDSKSEFKGLWLCEKTGTQLGFQSFELLVVAR